MTTSSQCVCPWPSQWPCVLCGLWSGYNTSIASGVPHRSLVGQSSCFLFSRSLEREVNVITGSCSVYMCMSVIRLCMDGSVLCSN